VRTRIIAAAVAPQATVPIRATRTVRDTTIKVTNTPCVQIEITALRRLHHKNRTIEAVRVRRLRNPPTRVANSWFRRAVECRLGRAAPSKEGVGISTDACTLCSAGDLSRSRWDLVLALVGQSSPTDGSSTIVRLQAGHPPRWVNQSKMDFPGGVLPSSYSWHASSWVCSSLMSSIRRGELSRPWCRRNRDGHSPGRRGRIMQPPFWRQRI